MQTTATMTVDQIRDRFNELLTQMDCLEVHQTGVIQDYPIGGTNRGKCALQVERHKSKGWRTVKTTTNKNGRWCAPKKSVYRAAGNCHVVSGDMVEKEFAWLSIQSDGIELSAANYDTVVLFKAPFTSPHVRRTPNVFTINGERHVYEADSPETIAAWDVWLEGLATVDRFLEARVKTAQPAEAVS